MILKLTDTTGEQIYYSEDVINRIRELNQELMETYPECIEYCIKIEEVLSSK